MHQRRLYGGDIYQLGNTEDSNRRSRWETIRIEQSNTGLIDQWFVHHVSIRNETILLEEQYQENNVKRHMLNKLIAGFSATDSRILQKFPKDLELGKNKLIENDKDLNALR